MKKIQSQSTSCANSIAQKAAVAALNSDKSFFAPMLSAYRRRHDQVLAALQKITGVECSATDGTFYLFPNFEAIISRLGLANDVALAEYLLEQAEVALVPGSAFGTPGYLRISCATSEELLAKACQQLTAALR